MKFKLIGNILRGVLKGFPVINAVIEAAKNVKAKKVLDSNQLDEIKGSVSVMLKADENGNDKLSEPHNWASIIFQIVTSIVLLYAFFTKQITPETVINLLRSIL